MESLFIGDSLARMRLASTLNYTRRVYGHQRQPRAGREVNHSLKQEPPSILSRTTFSFHSMPIARSQRVLNVV